MRRARVNTCVTPHHAVRPCCTAFHSAPQRDLRLRLIQQFRNQYGYCHAWPRRALFSLLRTNRVIAAFMDSRTAAALASWRSFWWNRGDTVVGCVHRIGDAVIGQLVRLVIREAKLVGTCARAAVRFNGVALLDSRCPCRYDARPSPHPNSL